MQKQSIWCSSTNTQNLNTDLRLELSFESSSIQYYSGGGNKEYGVVAADLEMVMKEEDQNACDI